MSTENTDTKPRVERDDSLVQRHSKLEMLSFSVIIFGLGSMQYFINGKLIFFYETEILFPISLMTLAMIFYTIWDMFNDPLIGNVSDLNTRFTRKWGKRFPWIIGSAIPLCVVSVLMFTPPDPQINVWATFLWFMLIYVLHDALDSTLYVNRDSLMPVKYRLVEERTFLGGLTVFMQTLAIIAGFLLPPLIISYGDPSSYVPMALIGAGLILATTILSIPGMREGKVLKESYFLVEKEEESFLKNFFGVMKTSVKNKNFLATVFVILGFNIYNALFQSAIPYFVRYVIKGEPALELLLYLPFILAMGLPIPLFVWLGRKFGHNKEFKYNLFVGAILSFVGLLIFSNLLALIIIIALLGMTFGLNNVLTGPVFGDFYDEAAVLTGKRQEGSYIGIRTFFGRTSYFIQVALIWLIHALTGFNAEAEVQTPLAELGIAFQAFLLPGIALLIGAILFWILWDINHNKTVKIKEKLKELGI